MVAGTPAAAAVAAAALQLARQGESAEKPSEAVPRTGPSEVPYWAEAAAEAAVAESAAAASAAEAQSRPGPVVER